jgi:tetratricopeptide (TPR) repeat protein
MVLSRRPGPVEPAISEALTALERGDGARAEAVLLQLEGQEGCDSYVHLLRGALLMRRGADEAALDELARLEPEGNVRGPALLLTAECLYRLNRLAEAESLMRRLAAEEPDNVDARRWLGAIYYDLGANDAAIVELERVIQLAPDDFRPHRLIGLMQLDFERYTDAVEHFQHARRLTPPPRIQDELLRDLGRCLIAQHQYHEALEVLEQAPIDASVLARRSECYWSLGDVPAAERLLSEACQMDPNARDVLYLRARLLNESGDSVQAADSLQHLLRQDPYDREAQYLLALVWRRHGDEDRYQHELARWQQLDTEYRRLVDLNSAAIRQPYDAELRVQLAEVCDALGKPELAASWRRAAETLRRPVPGLHPAAADEPAADRSPASAPAGAQSTSPQGARSSIAP